MSASILIPAPRPVAGGAFKPQLTSLVDVMTILLLFLLKSFSVEGEALQPAANLQLPSSTSRETAAPAVSVAVTREAVLVEGVEVLGLEELARRVDADEDLVPLAAALAPRAAAAGDDPQTRALTLQCDRGLDFRLLRGVMKTCSEAGFADFALLVQREEP